MKKLLLSAVVFFTVLALHAQTEEAYVKNDIREINKKEKAVKKEKRADKKELKKLRGSEVSFLAKNQFSRDFGDVPDVSWQRTANFDEATFTKDGQVTTAFYDDVADLVGTTVEKTFADLPYKAQAYINEKYNGYTTGDVLFYDDNEMNKTNMFLFNQPFDDVDSYFVELKKDNKQIVVQVTRDGDVAYFTRLE